MTPLFNLVLAALFFLHVWPSATESPTSMAERHQQWMALHQRTYKDDAEKTERLRIFKENVEFIDSFNAAGNRSYNLAINNFADLTSDEFLSTRTGFRMEPISKSSSFRYSNATQIPSTVDWREMGAVTDVKDQGSCDCCWAFSAVAATEGINKLTTGNLVSLSEQELLDCGTGRSSGCRPGFFEDAFNFAVKNNGLSTESDYPYGGVQGSCSLDRGSSSSRAGKIRGFESVPANSESALMIAVAHQPVSAGVDGSGYEFRHYSGGVFTGGCGSDLNHAVTVVGYGETSDGIKYWLAKNSWGSMWGENGYVRIQRESGVMGGLCGIAMRAAYPTA